MKKVLLILSLMLPLSMMAQMFMSSNQQLVEAAIKNGIIVVSQSYQLEDTVTHKRFGRYGNEEFGAFASLAVKTAGGVIVDSKVLSPWEQDANFKKYRNTHKPVLAHSKSIKFGDSAKHLLNLTVDSVQNCGRLTLMASPDSALAGFRTMSYASSVEGWMVWISDDSVVGEYEGTKNPELTIYRRTVEFVPDSSVYAVDVPEMPKKIWGGIFVVPEQTEIGQLTFHLAGVILRDGEDSWNLVCPRFDSGVSGSSPENELTPSGESDSKKQSNKNKGRK